MIIPHWMLSPEALRGVIEAFVTREGTDYGAQEVPLDTKVLQVQQRTRALVDGERVMHASWRADLCHFELAIGVLVDEQAA